MQLVGREKKMCIINIAKPKVRYGAQTRKNAREINRSDARLLREREEEEKE